MNKENKEQTLDLKYRPQSFEEFCGNETVLKSIRASLGTVHRYLFHGLRGCGKTTLARLVAKELGANEFDIYELDAASNRGIAEVKTLKAAVPLHSLSGSCKVYIIDECHQLTGDAKDALLKTLEEPPSHVYFILCTTEVGKVTQTIRSRTKAGEYELRPLHRRDLSELLDKVAKAEGLSLSPAVNRGLLAASEGIPRELLGLLEKVKSCSDEEAVELLQHGVLISADAKMLIDHLMGGSRWPEVRKVLMALKDSPEDVRRSIFGYMTKVLLGSDRPNEVAAVVIEELSRPFYNSELENRAMLALAIYRCVKD